MKAYTVIYKMSQYGEEQEISFLARTKEDAWDKATYEEIPAREGSTPYSAWVHSVTYQNGNHHIFNTTEGLPY